MHSLVGLQWGNSENGWSSSNLPSKPLCLVHALHDKVKGNLCSTFLSTKSRPVKGDFCLMPMFRRDNINSCIHYPFKCETRCYLTADPILEGNKPDLSMLRMGKLFQHPLPYQSYLSPHKRLPKAWVPPPLSFVWRFCTMLNFLINSNKGINTCRLEKVYQLNDMAALIDDGYWMELSISVSAKCNTTLWAFLLLVY